MRLLHLYWPHLPIRLARHRLSASFPTDRPVVLGGQPWTDGTVIDADLAARALGELSRAGIAVDDFALGRPSLDEVFLALTGSPAAG
jgi:hypothetical protein